MSRIAIIGAGVSGLATAALLARDGHEVDVFEQASEMGGRAGVWERDGFRWDTGPSWYLMPEVFERWFARAGTTTADHLDLVRLDPGYRVFSERGEAIDLATGRAARDMFESVEPGAGRRLARYLDDAAEAYRLSIDHFLYEPYRTPAAFLRPAVLRRARKLSRLLRTTLHERAAEHVADQRLQQVLEYPAVFLGGSPFQVPALYSLMSHLDLTVGVDHPMGGMRQIVVALERIARDAGANIHLGSDAEAIRVDGSGPRGRVTGLRVGGEEVAADAVVSTADLHETERLLGRRTGAKRPRTASPGTVLVLLGVRGALPQLPHHSLLFAERWRENFDAILGSPGSVPDPASLYVCHPSATDPSAAPDGDANLFVLVPAPADPKSGRGGVDGQGDPRIEAIADRAIAQIAKWADISDLAERIVVRRTIAPEDFAVDLRTWRGNALGLAHTLDQSALWRHRNTVRGIRGLHLAGADVLPGIGVPMCLISSEIVADRVARDSRRRRTGR